jgi:hypothetical protein
MYAKTIIWSRKVVPLHVYQKPLQAVELLTVHRLSAKNAWNNTGLTVLLVKRIQLPLNQV